MTTTTLSLSAPHLLAEYVRLPELTGFFEKRLVAPPDHAALLIRDGALVDAYHGANFSVGGIGSALKRLVVGEHHLRILLADLRPFSVQTPFKALTRDSVEIAAVATLELQLDPERSANIMGLIGPQGQLSRAEVLARFQPHLTDRVVEAVIGRVDANEIRGNVGLQDKVQADIMREVERLAGDLGLLVRGVSLEWAINAVEREAMQRADLDRAQDLLDQQLEDLGRNIGREADAAEMKLVAEVDHARLEMASEDELKRMVLGQELAFVDAREAGQRRQQLEVLAHEIQVLQNERVARFEEQVAEVGQAIDVAQQQSELRRIHRGIESLDQQHIAELRKLDALTGQDIIDHQRGSDLERSRSEQGAAREHIAELAKIEQSSDSHVSQLREAEWDGGARRDLDRLRAESDARLAQMKAGASMSPEQVLAVNAGLSSDVAAILAEQARANNSGNEQTMALMREMVAAATDARVASESQAREMFRMGMEGTVGVAHGAGGGPRGEASHSPAATEARDVTECAACGRENGVKNKHCIGCGARLRV